MPAKIPIYLKAANNKKGKKFKLRDILSPDMISPPLGDLRHTIHVGKEGQHDIFGDISFLQGNELLPGNQEKARTGQFPGHNEFFRANSTSDPMFTEMPSQRVRIPVRPGQGQPLLQPLRTVPDRAAEDMFDHSAPCELVKEKTKSEESLSDLTGSLLSLQLDLGPSFLDEVLNVMDRSK
ncbi:Cdc42 effector protein 3, partial [Eschrichtius robustus]|nr:Cdc42 effector protein 3 [Eschrichtius robustus]